MLWRYVRASMTLGPYLPPMCETYPNDTQVHYLVDGGYVNNLPADEMRRIQGPSTIVAVDVASYSSFGQYHDYGDRLSGCWQLWRSIASWFIRSTCFGCRCLRRGVGGVSGGDRLIPSMTDISTQLAYISETSQLPDRLRDDIDLYLKPGVSRYGTLEFAKFGEIREIGYKHARLSLKAWRDYLVEEDEMKSLREIFLGDDDVFKEVEDGGDEETAKREEERFQSMELEVPSHL